MTPDRERLLDMVVAWERAKAEGRPVEAEEICRDRPDLLTEFRRRIDDLRRVDWLNAPIESTPSCGREASRSSDPDLPRTMAGRYRLDALIGEGGFGRVYRSFDTWLERAVAIKVPRADRPVAEAEVNLCRLEARKVARLKHPNIVPVHDVGRDGSTCFIVSEWVEGVDLAARIRDDRPTPRESSRIVAEVAEAVGHAHRQGFVHRDIKPANILLDRDGRAYLTDFGIAAVEEELLGDVGLAGTPPYMAPEQFDPAVGPVDHRADIFALGVVLYELLTGVRPFRARSPVDLRRELLEGDPTPPGPVAPGLPARLQEICLRCLEKRPGDRYQAADLLAADLRVFLGG